MNWDEITAIETPCPRINVCSPPCINCKYWNPQQKYRSVKTRQVPDGIVCCHKENMFHDFSCFVEEQRLNIQNHPLKGC